MDEIAAAWATLDRFVTAYHQDPPPVDVNELANSLCQLRVRETADLSSVAGAPAGVALSGMLLPARSEIWVSQHEPWERRRFSIAHEVGHHILHAASGGAVFCRAGDLRPDPDSPEHLREREANRFAAELLMPADLVEREVNHHGPDPLRLCEIFRVSDLAMGFRLVNLGYLQALPVHLDEKWREWAP
jgi:hypothetical protein